MFFSVSLLSTGDAAGASFSAEQLAQLEMFMRDDDGGEFFMVNLVGFTEGLASHPDTGAKVDARELVQSYFRPFAVKILARAG